MKNRNGPFEILSTKEVYKNPWLELREDEVVRPGGSRGIFGVVTMKAGSSVIALTDDGYIYLVKEFKYGIESDSIELMSGALEKNESPLKAAKRELQEELGLEADDWIDLGLINPFTTVLKSPNYMFLARHLRESRQNPDDGEVLETLKVPFEEAIDMVMKGKITHGASCVAILKAAKFLGQEAASRS